MPNVRRIKGRMAELGITQKVLAKAVNCSQTAISQKINGQRPLYLDEAQRIAEALHIQHTEFVDYFFTP